MAASPKAKQLPHTLSERLKRLAQLPQDWDSYGAPPIQSAAINKAESVLREILAISGTQEQSLPSIAPSPDGGLELEWKASSGKELLLEIPASEGPLTFLLVELTGSGEENEIEGVIGEDYTLRGIIQRLLLR